MTKFLFIAATDLEVAPLRPVFEGRHPIVVVGMGSVEMSIGTIRAIERYCPDMVVNIGIAGAIDRSIAIGEVVVVASDYVADHGAWRDEQQKFVPFKQTIYKSDFSALNLRIVTGRTVTMACSPLVADGSQVETMEGAAFFAAAQACGVRAAQIRSISNYVGDQRSEWRVDEAVEALKSSVSKLF